ncbi:hypothetical protein IAD21_00295 [Abditibacteriota bacterium]|nr:hypothetical protein IAD21_00295 [Abditibacteriota bacterium]
MHLSHRIVRCIVRGFLLEFQGYRIPQSAPFMKFLFRCLGALTLGALAVIGLPSARAATLTVSTLADSGSGSLRATMQAANAQPDADTIVFARGLSGQITFWLGELPVNSNVQISGPGADKLSLRSTGNTRLLNITSGKVLLSGLTLSNGQAPKGGAIFNGTSGNLTISNCALEGNRGSDIGEANEGAEGGALYNQGTATIQNSVFRRNQNFDRKAGPAYSGGAIFNSGSLKIANCSFADNTSVTATQERQGQGGAIDNRGVLAISYSQFTGNQAFQRGLGGALCNSGTASLLYCSFSANRACQGGAIYNSGALSSVNATFAGNSTLGIDDNSNTSPFFLPGQGGAIYNASGNRTAQFTNNTFQGNSSQNYPAQTNYSGGEQYSAGALYNASGTVALQNCTLSENSDLTVSRAEVSSHVRVGTLANLGTLTSRNTVFVTPDAVSCFGFSTPPSGGDANKNFLFSNAASAGMGSLNTNGGWVETRALLSTSPLIDAGLSMGDPVTDARGERRLVGRGVDVGAYELGANSVSGYSLSGSVALANSTGSGPDDSGVVGVDITLFYQGNPIRSTRSDSIGRWFFAGLPSTVYTVAPEPNSRGYSYSPTSRTINLANANRTLAAFVATPLPALVVNTLYDGSNGDGCTAEHCTLREALAEAGPYRAVVFATFLTGTLQLEGEPLDVPDKVSIIGPGPSRITVSGAGLSRVFNTYSSRGYGFPLISGLTIRGGNSSGEANATGGALLNNGDLILRNCVFTGNRVVGGSAASGGGLGGAVFNGGDLIVEDCTFVGNTATENSHFGTGSRGGAIANTGQLSLVNCTLANNTVTARSSQGGAVYNGGDVTLNSCTFSGNIATRGGSLSNDATASVTNTIFNDTRGASIFVAGSASFSDVGYNLAADGGGGVLVAPTSKLKTNPLLGPLQENGGLTPTFALLVGSPALGAGFTDLLTDQRGESRPQSGATDIGAFETTNGVDTAAPLVGITTPGENQSIQLSRFGSASVKGTARDNGGVTRGYVLLSRTRTGITTYWNGESFRSALTRIPVQLGAPGATSTAWAWNQNFPTPAQLDAGTYSLMAMVFDAAGNQSSPVTRTFTLTTPITTHSLPSASAPSS